MKILPWATNYVHISIHDQAAREYNSTFIACEISMRNESHVVFVLKWFETSITISWKLHQNSFTLIKKLHNFKFQKTTHTINTHSVKGHSYLIIYILLHDWMPKKYSNLFNICDLVFIFGLVCLPVLIAVVSSDIWSIPFWNRGIIRSLQSITDGQHTCIVWEIYQYIDCITSQEMTDLRRHQ